MPAVAYDRTAYWSFNLVIGDAGGVYFVSSIGAQRGIPARGVHAVSNGSPLRANGRRCRRVRRKFAALEDNEGTADVTLVNLLYDSDSANDADLPDKHRA